MATQQNTTPPEAGLSAAWIKNFVLPPELDRLELADSGCAGLLIRFKRKGPPTFRWKITEAGRRRYVDLGPWSYAGKPGHVTLAQAHGVLKRLKLAQKDGLLAQAEADHRAWLAAGVEDLPAKDVLASGPTVETVAEEWYRRRILPVRTSPESIRRTLDRNLLPAVGDRPFADVDELELGRIVDAVVDGGAPVYAGTVLSHIKQCWKWGQGRGYLKVNGVRLGNPASALEAASFGVKKAKRRRIASDAELRLVWLRLEKPPEGVREMDEILSLGLRLLILLGLRSGELRRAKWSQIDWDEATLTVPPEHQKLKTGQARVPWIVPLPRKAVELLRELERLADGSEFIMPTPGHTPAKAGHVNKGSLSRALTALLEDPTAKKRVQAKKKVQAKDDRLLPHDMRRTMRSGLARLGVRLEVAERCLAHSVNGIEGVYNLHDYLDERRDALEQWSAHVEAVVHGPPPKAKPKLRAVK